ncbi:GumC family protein [Neptunitalea lumnitzerae]|uniref:non-specific protein-tyrosine kinase n=1 Tax=Neptunitalea lumnitzerae TaxID=2965509 RepID=A0ABQ5MIB4_9FLAO|nr:tyrosine-protein kinase family protein [Neptunitalea sp. Y10]GLB48672.1 tyrosine protein kinase [Neptunitalea sp. Y10]
MKKNQDFSLSEVQDDTTIDIKEILFRYLSFWPWFVLSCMISLVCAFVYIYYTPNVYNSEAKIKVIDDSNEMEVAFDYRSLLGGSRINLDNEIAVLTSFRLLDRVVDSLDLDVRYRAEGKIKSAELFKAPFVVEKIEPENGGDVSGLFTINLKPDHFEITDVEDLVYKVPYTDNNVEGLPFTIDLLREVDNVEKYFETKYLVYLTTNKRAVLSLRGGLNVRPTTQESEILTLSLAGENPRRTEEILNTIVYEFNLDGVRDRQLVSKRTIDFIDSRFSGLVEELDSIEVEKEDYKKNSDLSFIEADVQATIEKRAALDDQYYTLQTQISLVKLLKDSLEEEPEFSLLPADIGIENPSVNTQVTEYNALVLNRQKLLDVGAGENNPEIKSLTFQLQTLRKNIIASLKVYREQLNVSLKQVKDIRGGAYGAFSNIPKKERVLREIVRQQNLKEALYLMLLQKREEAAISYAVTAPSIKVVDYAVTNDVPVSPKKKIILAIGLIFGLAVPFVIINVIFLLDNKVHDRVDVEKENPEIPVLAEIPFIPDDNKMFNTVDDRSVLAESFRILSTNVDYVLGNKNEDGTGKVVFVTSTIKGEGKTFAAINMSLAFASVNHKVLLIGADLRNPQLHKYFKVSKDHNRGLSAYLHSNDMDFDECVTKQIGISEYFDVCFSGIVPPNAPQLLTSARFAQFVEEAKQRYDYVIFDLAPTLLVTDTLIVSKYADETVYLVRAGYTEKKILKFSKDLNHRNKLNNMAYIINNVGEKKSYKYGYEYGYNYSYSYNYGYGYGYGNDVRQRKKPWYKRLFGIK